LSCKRDVDTAARGNFMDLMERTRTMIVETLQQPTVRSQSQVKCRKTVQRLMKTAVTHVSVLV